jgi:hypothetical protein
LDNHVVPLRRSPRDHSRPAAGRTRNKSEARISKPDEAPVRNDDRTNEILHCVAALRMTVVNRQRSAVRYPETPSLQLSPSRRKLWTFGRRGERDDGFCGGRLSRPAARDSEWLCWRRGSYIPILSPPKETSESARILCPRRGREDLQRILSRSAGTT